MKSEKFRLKGNKWFFEGDNQNVGLVICFGARSLITKENYKVIKERYPNAEITMNSTAGEIFNTSVSDDTISGVAIEFDKTKLESLQVNIADFLDSFTCGNHIMNTLNKEDLQHLFILSDGGLVNGSELVKGINAVKTHNIVVTGGLAGDGTKFEKTFVGLNGNIGSGNVIAIAFYGKDLVVGHGSKGGWDVFGAERLVTKSKKNVLYELDGQSALELYKTYLGDKANELPGSALLFPLSMEISSGKHVVRTILAVDEDSQSMTFAGDIPEGAKVKLMRANFDRLIDGAEDAAEKVVSILTNKKPDLALLISCVGRKLVLGQRIEEEVDGVKEIFGEDVNYVGFYSYGEISPLNQNATCELHNQTMTITTYSEN